MEVYKAPQKYPSDSKFTIFLGGSIEQGVAKEWQIELTQKLSSYNFDIRILVETIMMLVKNNLSIILTSKNK